MVFLFFFLFLDSNTHGLLTKREVKIYHLLTKSEVITGMDVLTSQSLGQYIKASDFPVMTEWTRLPYFLD